MLDKVGPEDRKQDDSWYDGHRGDNNDNLGKGEYSSCSDLIMTPLRGQSYNPEM